MNDDEAPGLRKGISQGRSNWKRSDAPFGQKMRMLARNEWKKIRTLKTCCGNHGEPGC